MSNENKPLADAVADVGRAHARWWNALLAGDAAVLDTLLADDLTFHNPFGSTETKADFIGHIRAGRLKYDYIKDEVPLIRIHGQTGIVTGRVDIEYQWEGRPSPEGLYYTAVYGWTSPHWHMLMAVDVTR